MVGTNAHVILQHYQLEKSQGAKLQPPTSHSRRNKTWDLAFSQTHIVFKNHKVYDTATLPGLAYIDILFQFFAEKGFSYQDLQLQNLSIHRAFTIADSSNNRLIVNLKEEENETWNIQLLKQLQQGDLETGEKELLCTAEIKRSLREVESEQINIELIKKSALKVTPLSEAYGKYRDAGLVHTGWMKARGAIFETNSATYIQVDLAPEALGTASQYLFHPVLLDASAVGAQALYEGQIQQEDQLFLPLFYQSFQALGLLQDSCFTRIDHQSIRNKNELIYLSMAFFNKDGTKVADLKDFAIKLVRNKYLSEPSTPTPSPENLIKISSETIETYLRELVGRKLHKSAQEIDPLSGYYEMGLESALLLEIVGEIEQQFSIKLIPILLFEYTTIRELADYLEDKIADSSTEKTTISSTIKKTESSTRMPAKTRKVPSASPDNQRPEDIAIIGLAGRYPGARNIEEFWENLKTGKDCISEIPFERWDHIQFNDLQSPSGKPMSRYGGFIDEVDGFDPHYFRISPREAKGMDPQERHFLEVCTEAMQDAGYNPDNIVESDGSNKRRKVGVFAGVMHKDYALLGENARALGKRFPLSLNYAPIANRVSFTYNFHGPSMAVDTVCSSSLTAIHLAINSIRAGECKVAFAGGVNLSLHPAKYMTYGLSDMHSSDGRCRSFGEGGGWLCVCRRNRRRFTQASKSSH